EVALAHLGQVGAAEDAGDVQRRGGDSANRRAVVQADVAGPDVGVSLVDESADGQTGRVAEARAAQGQLFPGHGQRALHLQAGAAGDVDGIDDAAQGRRVLDIDDAAVDVGRADEGIGGVQD